MTTIENYKGEQFEIETYFGHEFKGRGGWNISCDVSFKGERKTFSHYTTDSMFIDQISDMKGNDASFDEIQNAYKEEAFYRLEESILEWVEYVNEEN
jgi:hypothetical protein